MDILTFDIEEWYVERMFKGDSKNKYEKLDSVLGNILELLDEEEKRATFFCLGEMARIFPSVVKRISQKGHEVGCHSNEHLWLTKLDKPAVLKDTRIAIDSLEQCTGTKVTSYRAPAFSIGNDNKWAFEILSECGITRDASVFPAVRDFGGFSSFNQKEPSIVKINGVLLKEFPISTFNLWGTEIAFTGGGYFRLFPYSFVSHQMNLQKYSMTYFHLWDLIPETKRIMTREEYENYFKENGSLLKRYKRFIKSNLGTGRAYTKLVKLIKSKKFISIEEADQIIDWEKVPVVEI